MLKYTTEQLASIIALPIVVILLCWTVVIFHKNRNKWGPYDIPIVSVLTLSVLRNLTILGYTLAIIFAYDDFDTEYCSIVTWLFNSLHTFQASSLTSIAVIGLFAVKLHRKSQTLKTFLTSTHIIYHLFCLTTLCACVGVAAILAQKDGGLGNVFADTFDVSPCDFLPFELDVKFNVFIIVLHVFLASISFVAFLIICYNYCKMRKEGFDYMKKSNSDLSELSNNFHGINANVNENRNFYDTYTIHRAENNNCCNKDTWTNAHFNNSEVLSNNSTTVSSTNSRRPCIVKQNQEDEDESEVRRTGLETMHPVLIVCYLFYHLPLIILCAYPKLIHPWRVTGIALWLGLVQDLLIPIGLGIVDSRFCSWVTEVYSCSTEHTDEKLPQVGVDGKFRPFGLSSQPQSLENGQHERNKNLQQVEHRFPITNGSLYTSIDGRLPVIHNYRRHKEFRTGTIKQHHDLQSSNVALHSSHLNRRDADTSPPEKYSSCSNCDLDQCPSHSNLHHLSPQYVHRKLSFLQASQNSVFPSNGDKHVLGVLPHHQNCLFLGTGGLQDANNLNRNSNILIDSNRQRNFLNQTPKRLSQSQESINHLYFDDGDGRLGKMGDTFCYRSEMNIASPSFNLNANLNSHMIRNSRNLIRLNKMRLSRSEESLTDLQLEAPIVITCNPQKLLGSSRNTKPHPKTRYPDNQQYSSDDEDCFTDHNESQVTKEYDSISSSNSITTEANCDFEFFQAKEQNNNGSFGNENNSDKKLQNDLYYQLAEMTNFQVPQARPKQINISGSDREHPKHISNTKITRSNSKRSLEDFQFFVEKISGPDYVKNDENVSKIVILHRSNSYTTLEDKRRRRRCRRGINRSNSKVSESVKFEDQENDLDMGKKKIKSVEYLPNSRGTNVCVKDLTNNNNGVNYIGSSVPDFKKVFISEYI